MKPQAMKLITAAADIKKAIASIAARGKLLDSSIHVAGVSVLAHATAHGDTTLCDALVNAMPKGGRKLALVEWMLAYGQIAKLDPKTDKDAVAAGRLFKMDKARKYDEASAIATPWTEFKKEAEPLTAFDAQAGVVALIARLTAAGAKGVTIEHKAEALASARELVKALGGE